MKLLRQASRGNIWLVRAEGGTILVLKEIQAAVSVQQSNNRISDGDGPAEASLLSAQHHPYIVRLVEVVSHQPSGGLGLITEFCDRGDLHTWLSELRHRGERLAEAQVLTWLAQICSALAYLHGQGVIHRE